MRNYEGCVALGQTTDPILKRNLFVIDRFLREINAAGIPQGQPPRAGAGGGGHNPGCCPNEVDEFENVHDATEGILSFGRADSIGDESLDLTAHTYTRIEGFELNLINNASGNDLVTGAVTVQTSTVYSGTYALQVAPAGAAAHYSFAWVLSASTGAPTNASPPAAVSGRFRMRFSAFPGSTADIVTLLGASTRSNLQITSGGVLVLDGVTGTTVLALNTWYEITFIYDSAGSGEISLYIDRVVEFDAATPATAGTTTYLRFGSGATPTYTMFIDDIAVESASAVADISIPPPGQIFGVPLSADGLLTGSFATVGAATEWQACTKPHDGATSSINCSSGGVATQRKGFVQAPPVDITDRINAVQFCWSAINPAGGSFTVVPIASQTNSSSSADYTELTSGSASSGSTYRLFGALEPVSIWSGERWTRGELDLMAWGVRISLNANQVNTSTCCLQVDVEDVTGLSSTTSFARAIRVTADEGYVIPANMVADDEGVTTDHRGWLNLGWDGTLARILLTDSTGRLVLSPGSGAAPSETDDAAFTIGSDAVSPVGFLADEAATDAVDEGDVGIARMDVNRRQLVRVVGSTDANRLQIDANGAIDVSELPAAAALADNVANPTTTIVAAYVHGRRQGGTTYDRVSNEVADSNTLGATDDRGIHSVDLVKYHRTADLSNVNVVFDDSPTSANSQTIDCSRFREFLLFYTVDSTNTPTDIQFIVQFSQDGGTTWFDYRNDFWGQLIYDDVACATAISRCHSGRCVGDDIRLRVVCTGTTAANTFTVSNARFIFKN